MFRICKHIVKLKFCRFRSVETRTQNILSTKIFWDAIFNAFDPSKEASALGFCQSFRNLETYEKQNILQVIAVNYGFDSEAAKKIATSYVSLQDSQPELVIKSADRLKNALLPKYQEGFVTIAKLNHGIKFLVDLRADVLDLLSEMDRKNSSYFFLKSLNNHLKDLLALCFNVGFLTLERVTWNSSCHILQKISEYEAVHPMRHWADLKQRVGAYRRCFVFVHSTMPKEPIVMLHTALTEDISSSISSIVMHGAKVSSLDNPSEDQSAIQSAIFYSITSTQKGLRGIELGNQLIKRVVGEILKEFPHISKFSSLSPIPGFREWLLMEIEKAKRDTSVITPLFSAPEVSSSLDLKGDDSDIWNRISRLIASNQWVQDDKMKDVLRLPLLKSCAHYLYKEKRRQYALNSIAHFHLRNGAELWRLNWTADLSLRGLSNSCGIMVNYRYFMEQTENNSQKYVQDYYVKISENVEKLLKD